MKCWVVMVGACALALGAGCSTRHGGGRGDASVGDGGLLAGCDQSVDSDGDGVADDNEGTSDLDGDGTPNYLDLDTDGDGIDDRTEHGGAHPCARPDGDMDGRPPWWDTDSDNDGLTDAEEVGLGTDPSAIDTDGDGITDLGEVRGTMTSPTDPGDSLPEGDFFVVLPYLGPHENRNLDFGTDISVADVYFLIDTTGSMGGPIANVRSSLRTIAAEIQTRIENVQMGVGHFEDFPNAIDLFAFDGYGMAGEDAAYEHFVDITPDLAAVQAGLDRLVTHNGMDGPESHVEALYQTATGEGGSWSFATGAPVHTIAPRTCPSVPDDPGRRTGYPCFRAGALPIIVLVTDVTWHNGPAGVDYAGITPAPHTFDQAAAALTRIGARFIGVGVYGGGRTEAEEMARRTGTVDGAGTPLVYDAVDGTVSSSIVEGIATLTGGTRQDVTTRTENVPGNPDEFDATMFIKSITPVEGYRMGVAGAGYDSRDDVAFYGVIPGTRVTFAVDFFNDVRMPADTAQIFRAEIIVVGNGVADLDHRNVYIIVPPEGGTILI